MSINPAAPGTETEGDDLILGTLGDDIINALGGDDVVLAKAGDDTVFGGEGIDILLGLLGDDLLVGDTGDDFMFGGFGDDTMVWNNGDGSDLMDGGEGDDRALVNGADTAGDEFVIAPGDEAGFVQFARQNLGLFEIDITNTETLEVNGLGGDDLIRGSEGLAGLIALELNGDAGKDTIIGGDGDDILSGGIGADLLIGAKGNDIMLGGLGRDTMVWNNGDGSDVMDGGEGRDKAIINGADGAGDVFELSADGAGIDFARTNLGPFTIDIENTERVEVNGLGGDDVIQASEGMAGLARLVLDGGAGNDSITGSDGTDVLRGGADNDVLVGAKGDDRVFGGAGDDLLVWNNGDGSDLMNGGRGFDTVQVNGADGAGDQFAIDLSDDGVAFARTNLGPFELDIRKVEVLEVNGLGGNDEIIAAADLSDEIQLMLDGGAGHDTIVGGSGDDVIRGGEGSDLLTGGAGADTFVFFENDTGVDVITDFEVGVDTLQFVAAPALAAARSVNAPYDPLDAMVQVGNDVHLDTGTGMVVFEEMTLAGLGPDSFDVL
ncbi:MAG: calcium-binding protein [Pseudomonadota bacterium]